MELNNQIAKHFREVMTGGNWTFVNVRDTLNDITWQEATYMMPGFNTIAALVYHIHYYIRVVLPVMEGGTLNASDKFSFDVPPISSPEEWTQLVNQCNDVSDQFANAVEKVPSGKMGEIFSDPKYGSWYRNLHGIVEHTHYHLGQIVILKKIIRERLSSGS